MTYPQQPFAGQGPPKKSTAAIVALVAVVVLLLGGLGFTGFVAPGFFLAADGTGGGGTTAPPPTTSSPVPPGSDPTRLLETVVEALGSQDTDVLKDVACREAGSAVHKVIDDVTPFRGAEPVGSRQTSADVAVATFEVANTWKKRVFEVKVVREGGTWCWLNIARADVGGSSTKPANPTTAPTDPGAPTAGGKPVDPAGLAALRTFVDNLNAGDAAKAKAQLCADGIKKARHVDELIGHDPDLGVDSAKDGLTSGPESFQLYLRGTAKGQRIEGHSGSVWMTGYDGSWCVHAFTIVVI